MGESVVSESPVASNLLQLAGHVKDSPAASERESEDEDVDKQAVVGVDFGPNASALGGRSRRAKAILVQIVVCRSS